MVRVDHPDSGRRGPVWVVLAVREGRRWTEPLRCGPAESDFRGAACVHANYRLNYRLTERAAAPNAAALHYSRELQPSIPMQELVDSGLTDGTWRAWRDALSPAERVEGAKAWCASSHWKAHTPHLEDWKAVVSDLKQHALSEAGVEAMSQEGGAAPFPPVPLFEDEQVRD